MIEKTCKECRYFTALEQTNTNNQQQGHCQQSPPIMHMVTPPQNVITPGQPPKLMKHTEFPIVVEDWWCGQYMPKLNS